MPGLSFLNKKGFHTTNLKNVERVWIAEQKHEQEKKKLAELQKQLEEERQILELRRLQAASGEAAAKTLDNSLDWMYEGPMSGSTASAAAVAQQSSEEYLLGKIYTSKDSNNKNIIDNNVGSSNNQGDSTWLKRIATSKNDVFTRKHEDPFILIKQQEQKIRENILKNPIKMDKIRQKISNELHNSSSNSKKAKKLAKKEKKKAKKEKKKSKKHSSNKDVSGDGNTDDDSSDNNSDNNSNKEQALTGKKRSRSRSPILRDTKGNRNDNRNDQQSSNRGRGDADSRERGTDRNIYRGRDDSRDRRSRTSNRDGNMDDDRYRRKHSSRDRNYRGRSGDRSTDRYSKARNDDRNRSDREDSADSVKEKRFGLISKSDKPDVTSRTFLGPNPELLRKKKEQEHAEAAAKKSIVSKARDRSALNALTEEEKLQRIKEMEAAANRNDSIRVARYTQSSNHNEQGGSRGMADVVSGSSSNEYTGNAAFLSEMRKQVYVGSEKGSAIDIKSRIEQNKHYRQSSADIDSAEGFLSKK